jgi:hypothetical protein
MRGDFESFRSRARAFLAQFPDDPSIVIGDREGRQVFNSSRPVGEPLRRAPFAETGMRFSARVSRSFPNSSPDPCRTGRS